MALPLCELATVACRTALAQRSDQDRVRRVPKEQPGGHLPQKTHGTFAETPERRRRGPGGHTVAQIFSPLALPTGLRHSQVGLLGALPILCFFNNSIAEFVV